MSPILSRSQVQDLLIAAKPPVLLDVLTPEHFAQRRLPGARNACIYETAFPETIRSLGLDPTAPIIVYGEGSPYLDSQFAAARLREAGFQNVSDFRGGLREWQLAGLPVEGSGLEARQSLSGRFAVDTEKSIIRWTGRNLFNHHEGTLRLASGWLEVADNALTAAEFIVDMRSIVCTDLTDSTYNAMLLRHLAHDDFFATAEHPTARFVIHSAEPLPTATEGLPNYILNGEFTLRGVTKALSFPAVIAAADADHLTGQALVQLDRTEYGSLYGSGKFFAFLGKHVVNDHIDLHLKLHATKTPAEH